MIRLGITGGYGFLGWHLRCYFHQHPQIQAIPIDRSAFSNDAELIEFCRSCDAIIHLAGMNRGSEAEILPTNVALTKRLLWALEQSKTTPHLLFSSSTQIYLGTPYGESKKISAKLMQEWSEQNQTLFTNLIMPNLFGEHGKPFYNSVIATFSYQLANGQTPHIIEDREIELIHARDVGSPIHRILIEKQGGDISFSGTKFHVSQILTTLKAFHQKYTQGIIPIFKSRLELDLFNTLRSKMYPTFYPVTPQLHSDPRGSLFEGAKSEGCGQFFISTTHPGITRGNHFHTRKVERFCVLKGEAVIEIRRLFSHEIDRFQVSGSRPQYVDIPTLHTHSIKNTGTEELLTLFWAHELYDPTDGDTYPEKVYEAP